MTSFFECFNLVIRHPKSCWTVFKDISTVNVIGYYIILSFILLCLKISMIATGIIPTNSKFIVISQRHLLLGAWWFFSLFVIAWINHIILNYLGVKGSFNFSLKAFVFGTTPILFEVILSGIQGLIFIKFIFGIIISIWYIALYFQGIKILYNTTLRKVLMAFLIGTAIYGFSMFLIFHGLDLPIPQKLLRNYKGHTSIANEIR